MKKLIFLCFAFTFIVSAQTPNTINYQGVLKDSGGNYLDGSYDLVFSLYQELSEGTAVWTETHSSYSVTDGILNIELGSSTPFGLSFSRQYYLEISVDGTTLTPRSKLASTPYSIYDGMPVGTVLTSMLDPTSFGTEIGDGWVLADGRDVSGSRYATLTSLNNVPDIRGMFLRGMNQGRSDGSEDPDTRSVGDFQSDAFQGHIHSITGGSGGGAYVNPRVIAENSDQPRSTGNPTSDGINGTPRTASETRPKNISVYYYVKIN